MLAKVLVIVPFIRIAIFALTTLVHYPAVGSFMLHQIAFVGKFLLTKGLLTFVIPGFAVTDHMVVKLTFKRKVPSMAAHMS